MFSFSFQISADPVRVTVCNAHEGRFTEHVCVRVPGITIRQAVRIRDKPDSVWIEGASAAIEGVSLDIEVSHYGFIFNKSRIFSCPMQDQSHQI